MKIRKATQKDIKQLEELYLRYNDDLEKIVSKDYLFFSKKKKDCSKEIKKVIIRTIKDKSSIILVAEEKDQLIGTISGWITIIKNDLFNDKVKFGYLQYLYLLPIYRNKGFSTKLKDELLKWFKDKNCDWIRLEVASTNTAIKAYEKWGFKTDSIKMIQKLKT